MAYKVKIEGNESFELAKECVNSVFLSTDIPIDSNARTNDAGATMEITGKILTAVDGDPFDSTRNMALWSMVSAQNKDCYRKVTVEQIVAGITKRKYVFPNAFVVNYKERHGDEEGVGNFTLVIKADTQPSNKKSVVKSLGCKTFIVMQPIFINYLRSLHKGNYSI